MPLVPPEKLSLVADADLESDLLGHIPKFLFISANTFLSLFPCFYICKIGSSLHRQ